MDITQIKDRSKTLGFGLRGQEVNEGAVVSKIPDSLADAEMSVCGIKGFMVDELRAFEVDGEVKEVLCASVACLEITDSPVHVHGETVENYIILEGEGTMVLDNKIVELSKGTVVTLPPGVAHGAASKTETPLKVLMTFSPGLAPKDHADVRDEKILHDSTRARIAQL